MDIALIQNYKNGEGFSKPWPCKSVGQLLPERIEAGNIFKTFILTYSAAPCSMLFPGQIFLSASGRSVSQDKRLVIVHYNRCFHTSFSCA